MKREKYISKFIESNTDKEYIPKKKYKPLFEKVNDFEIDTAVDNSKITNNLQLQLKKLDSNLFRELFEVEGLEYLRNASGNYVIKEIMSKYLKSVLIEQVIELLETTFGEDISTEYIKHSLKLNYKRNYMNILNQVVEKVFIYDFFKEIFPGGIEYLKNAQSKKFIYDSLIEKIKDYMKNQNYETEDVFEDIKTDLE